MKKFLSLTLAVIMMATMSVTAFAADETKDTTVTYSVDPSYTVTIPATVELGGEAEIKAENVVLDYQTETTIGGYKYTYSDYYLTVSLTGTSGTDNAFTLSNNGYEIEYTVKNGGTEVAVGDTVLKVDPAQADNGSVTLSFEAPSEIKYAGEYTGTVTFTISVVAGSETKIEEEILPF